MAADPSYDAFIAQLERKHQVEAPGHNSYFEVFNEASRLIGQLKKGLNVSIHRERQSEVRVAAQSWQDAYYNARTDTSSGSGVDILDWQPRYAHLDLSEAGAGGSGGGSGSGAGAGATSGSVGQRATRSAAAASPTAPSSTHQHRRSNTSPTVRRHGHAAAAVASPAAAGEPPSPPAAAPLSAGDRAVSEPLTPSYKPGQLYNGGGGGAGARACPGSPRLVGTGPQRGRRATDSLLTRARRGSAAAAAAAARDGSRGRVASAVRSQPQAHQQQYQQQRGMGGDGVWGEEERGDGGEDPAGLLVVTVREGSFLGSPGQLSPPQQQSPSQQQQQQQRLLPPLDEPSGPVLCSPTSVTHGGSRVDEAIRVFARTAYEPGEHRHSLLLAPSPLDSAGGGGGGGSGGGGGGGDGSDPHHLEPLPLAPIPRTVPRHVTEALSSMLLLPPAAAGGIRGPGVPSYNEGGGGGFARFSYEALSSPPGSVGPDLAGISGRPLGVALPQPPSTFHPQPPDEPLSGPYPRPQCHRIRPSPASCTGGPMAAAAAATAPAGRGGGSDWQSLPPPPPLLPGRGAARRVSTCGPWDQECPSSPAPPSPPAAAAPASAWDRC